jgi:hypothetical protein
MLLELSKVLQNKSKIEQKEFIELYELYGAKKIDFNEESTYYRDSINRALESSKDMASIAKHGAVILNKNSGQNNSLYRNKTNLNK